MSRIKRGTRFRGLVLYSLFGKKGEDDYGPGHGYVIGGSVSSYDPKSMVAEFEALAALRPDIQKPVWHNSLRQPAGEDLTDDKWLGIAEAYLTKMGFNLAKTLYAVVKHKQEHVHLNVCRVLLDGSVYLGKNENLRSVKAIAEIEKEFGLTITKNALDENGNFVQAEKKSLTKNEIDKAVRTGEWPPRLVLQEALDLAMRGKPTVCDFIERLENFGVVVMPNFAPTTERLNGFSFAYKGIPFKASELGNKYKWSRLSKEVSYVEARDGPKLARLRSAIGNRESSQRATGADATHGADSAGAVSNNADASDDTGANRAERKAFSDARPVPKLRDLLEIGKPVRWPKLESRRQEEAKKVACEKAEVEVEELQQICEQVRCENIRQARELRVDPCRTINPDRSWWRSMGINPRRERWLVVREEILIRQYGCSSDYLIKFFKIRCSLPRREIVFENDAARIADKGPLLMAREGNRYEIDAMLELASLKGWTSLRFTGTAKFKQEAMRAALSRGFKVTTHNAKDEALLQQARADIDPLEDSGPHFRPPAPRRCEFSST